MRFPIGSLACRGHFLTSDRSVHQKLRNSPAITEYREIGRFEGSFAPGPGCTVQFGTYNTAVAAVNEIIAAKKRQVQAANLRQLETELTNLRATKIRHSAGVVS